MRENVLRKRENENKMRKSFCSIRKAMSTGMDMVQWWGIKEKKMEMGVYYSSSSCLGL